MKLTEYIKRFGKFSIKDKDCVVVCDGKNFIGGVFNKKGRML